MHFCQISPQKHYFLIISLTIECADHIRSSSLSPVNHRSQKTLSFSLGKSLPKSSNQDRGGLPPIRNEQGRPWCTCCWPVACPPTVEHVHILLQRGPFPLPKSPKSCTLLLTYLWSYLLKSKYVNLRFLDIRTFVYYWNTHVAYCMSDCMSATPVTEPLYLLCLSHSSIIINTLIYTYSILWFNIVVVSK